MVHYSYDRKISRAMRERKRLAVPLEIKSVDSSGHFAGYASVFDVVDSQRDVIERGAFADSIRGRERQVKLLWQHQPDEPIGVTRRLFEDARGLYMEGQLLMGVQRAREAQMLMKSGAVSGLSIGYSPTRYTIDAENGVRRLKAVELWEISLVTFPANAGAQVTVVKDSLPRRGRVRVGANLRKATGTKRECPPPGLPLTGGGVHPALLLPLYEALETTEKIFTP